jgi:hypothetical protein
MLRRFVNYHYQFVTRLIDYCGIASLLLIGHNRRPRARPMNPSLACELGFLLFGLTLERTSFATIIMEGFHSVEYWNG